MDRASDYFMRESLIGQNTLSRRGRVSPPPKLHVSKEGPAPAKKQLVVCFMSPDPRARNEKYSFEFFQIENLLVPSTDDTFDGGIKSQFLEPERTLVWTFSGSETYYKNMSFIHSSKDEVVYVGGGLDRLPIRISHFLPNELSYFPLGNNYFPIECLEVKRTTPMKSGKYAPLIVEIGSYIYVMSAPPPIKVFMEQDSSSGRIHISTDSWCSFEVYTPSEDTWETLPHPPLMEPVLEDYFFVRYRSPLNLKRRYSYLVVGSRKLLVSDGVYSCVFDTVDKEWETCYLFSNIFKDVRDSKLPKDCDLGFPFRDQAILWKENIYLCIILNQMHPPVAAFKILDDGVEAVEVPVLFDEICLWRGECVHMVDLGDDHIALLLYEEDLHHKLTIVTYKLYLGDDGTVTGVRNSVRYCEGDYYAKQALYCFAL